MNNLKQGDLVRSKYCVGVVVVKFLRYSKVFPQYFIADDGYGIYRETKEYEKVNKKLKIG